MEDQVAAVLERAGGRQQVDDHARGNLPKSPLKGTYLGEGLIDHLQRDVWASSPDARGRTNPWLPCFMRDDALIGRLSLRCCERLSRLTASSTGAPLLTSKMAGDQSTGQRPHHPSSTTASRGECQSASRTHQ